MQQGRRNRTLQRGSDAAGKARIAKQKKKDLSATAGSEVLPVLSGRRQA
ncbi:MAG: hypothetical protein U0794_22045 [Isosphaeraceae bacterium]